MAASKRRQTNGAPAVDDLKSVEQLVVVVEQLSRARDLGSLIDLVPRAARALTEAAAATLALEDDGACQYVSEDAPEPMLVGRRFQIPDCPSGWVIRRGEPIVLEQIGKDPRVPKRFFRGKAMKSLAVVPIRADAPLGAIGIYWHDARPINARQLNLLKGLAYAASIAFDNVGLYRDLEHRAEDAERNAGRNRILADASAALGESFDYEETLTSVGRLLVPALADSYQVVLFEDGSLKRVAAVGVDARRSTPEYFARLAAAIDSSITRDGQDTIVPLVVRKTRLGAVILGRNQKARVPSSEDLELWEEIARRAASSVEAGRLYRQAQEAIRARDEFLSIASHELRTPLTALQLQLQAARQLLEKFPPQDPRVARRVERADMSVQKLARLVDELLGISRITLGLMTIHHEPFDMREAVSDVVERLSEQALRAGSKLVVHGETPAVGRWDRLRIEQVLTNLISNAINYGNAKPIEVTIGAGAKVARVSVRDHGIGIADEDRERIFSRFERAVSKWHHGGLGLGLFVTRQIVEAHGGTIRVESRTGKGSTFTVELPYEQVHERPQPAVIFRTPKESKRSVPR